MIGTKLVTATLGAVTSALGSALCCSGPIVAASLGMSGAGLAAVLPYRPLFLVAAGGFLFFGFHQLDRQEEACDAGRPCADAPTRRIMRLVLWTATAVVLLFGTSSRWISLFLN